MLDKREKQNSDEKATISEGPVKRSPPLFPEADNHKIPPWAT